MIARLIDFCLRQRVLVLLLVLLLTAVGIGAIRQQKLDALPDLSDVQVIVKTDYPGRAPQLVEDQVTYPLAASLLATPGASTVRGFSMFGESYVYVIFADGTDLYWARSRVLERLAQISSRLPDGASAALGPDASGVGWVYQYALVDHSGKLGIDRLRALQDFNLRYELQSVPGVAEVATVGGAGRQFQVDIDPSRLAALKLNMTDVAQAIASANRASGAGAFEMGRQRYMVRSTGYLKTVADFADISIANSADGTPILLRQVGSVSLAPQPSEGVTDLDGQGEAVSGIVVMRHGENALATIRAVKDKLQALKASLPAGVELVTTYDRSGLIERAVTTLRNKLVEESIAVALICALFLGHIRASLVAIGVLTVGIVLALWIMQMQGVSANIMSLGGIAIAIGAMVDAAVVMIENMHRRLEMAAAHGGSADTWRAARDSAVEVGPSLFFSLLVITLSFLPVFALGEQEGRLFKPLAYTKTYAMGLAALLSITLAPVLMGYAIRGRVQGELRNPLNRALQALYRPLLGLALGHPRKAVALAVLVLASGAYPLMHLGSEYMPALDEGDLLYMPTTLPGVSADEARSVLQITNRLIRQQPEVAGVFGKAGRADSATDPAPLSMLESTIRLKPQAQWPAGETPEQLVAKLDQQVKLAGLTNSWGFPIRTRIDMLSTGVRTPLAVKISGPDLGHIQQLAEAVETRLRGVSGVRSVFAERVGSGRYLDIDVDRSRAARLGLRIADVQATVEAAVGGAMVGTVPDGRERYPVVVRYPQPARSSPEAIGAIRLRGSGDQVLPLREVANIRLVDGPSEVKSENARPIGYVFVDVGGQDVGAVYRACAAALGRQPVAEPGYSVSWIGQYLQYERARERLYGMIALAVALVLTLLYFHFRRASHVALVLACLPFGLVGGLWLLYLLGYQLSVAVIVGLIALAGVAAEFGVVMLLYLDQAVAEWRAAGSPAGQSGFSAALVKGALLRLRPKAMTVAVILAGLIPVMLAHSTGADVMKRIAAPLVGGMVSAPLFSLLIMPALYLIAFGQTARSNTPEQD